LFRLTGHGPLIRNYPKRGGILSSSPISRCPVIRRKEVRQIEETPQDGATTGGLRNQEGRNTRPCRQLPPPAAAPSEVSHGLADNGSWCHPYVAHVWTCEPAGIFCSRYSKGTPAFVRPALSPKRFSHRASLLRRDFGFVVADTAT
jgi:hypothetical protein